MSLMQMSFSGAVMILAIILVRALSIHKLPKKVFVLLWEIVVFRLLIPVSIPSMFSAYSFVSRSIPMQEAITEIPTNKIFFRVTEAPLNLNAGTTEIVQNGAKSLSAWGIIWIVGMLLCVAFFGMAYLRCYVEFQTSLPVCNEFANRWLKEHRLKRSIRIRQSDRIYASLTYGIFRPVILMPKKTDWENTQQLQYVLLHEYMHICRFDMVRKMITIVVLCIHWFNPFVWVMYFLFNRDIELSCDESVVRQFGEDCKSTYARALIAMEEKKSRLTPLGNYFSKNAIEERISAIMKLRKTTIGAIIISATVIVAIVVLFATSAEKQSDETDGGVTVSTVSEDELGYWDAGCIKDISPTSITVDVVEFVTDDDTERKEELIEELDLKEGNDLSDGRFLNGYYIYNEDNKTVAWELTDETIYTFIDWGCKYTGLDYPEYYSTTDRNIFEEYMKTEYGMDTPMPFFFDIEDGVVKRIYEKFIP